MSSLKYRYELHKWAIEQLCPKSAIMHSPFDVTNEGNIPEMSEQIDLDVFYCLKCGKKCEEEEILDGSNVGFTLLMKCTEYACSNYFQVTYDRQRLLENVKPIGPMNCW